MFVNDLTRGYGTPWVENMIKHLADRSSTDKLDLKIKKSSQKTGDFTLDIFYAI